MSIAYHCVSCGSEHPSRLLALRPSYFRDVIPRLGSINERCPKTGDWVTVTHGDMRWAEDEVPMKVGV